MVAQVHAVLVKTMVSEESTNTAREVVRIYNLHKCYIHNLLVEGASWDVNEFVSGRARWVWEEYRAIGLSRLARHSHQSTSKDLSSDFKGQGASAT